MRVGFTLLFLVFTGPGLLWIGIQSLRRGWWRESVPLLEAVIDQIAGIEPPARNSWDRRLAFAQAILFTIFGIFFSLCLAAVLFTFFVPE